MAIAVACPKCGRRFELAITQASRPIVCPQCGHVLRATRAGSGEYALLSKPVEAPEGPPAEPTFWMQVQVFVERLRRFPWRRMIPLAGAILFLLAVWAAVLAYQAAVESRQRRQTPPPAPSHDSPSARTDRHV